MQVERIIGGSVLGRPRYCWPGAAGLALLVGAPAMAQDDDRAIEQLLAETETPQAAMATARVQQAEGDVTGAAATLERALLTDPNAHEARLLYAATLCRLGDPQGARIEIAKLDRQDISEAGWEEANNACGGGLRRPLPAETGSGAGLTGDVYLGLAYDRDASGALVLQTDFLGGGERDHGWAAIAGARLNWRSERYATDGGAYAGASIASKHDIGGPDQDYDIGELRLGYGHGGGATAWSIGPVLRHIRLFNDPYVTEFGGQGDLLLGNAGANKVRIRAEGVYQDYHGDFPGDDGDGPRFDLSAAYETRLADKGYATIGIGAEWKDADERLLSYRGGRLFAALQKPFANRHYVSLAGTVRYVDFRDDDGFDRKDWRWFARAAYGIPLGNGGLHAEGAASYTYRKVKTDGFVELRDYSSPGADLRLIWKF